ncbi:MAG: Flp pilus assembly protein CpaB [Bacillaceae bacterium]|nr:Flp pilus assembly protein CpaB [Bacillaceae bacterium]
MKTRTIFIIAVILAAITTGVFYYYMNSMSFETTIGQKTITVVQTTQPVSPYQTITSQMVESVEIPYSESYSNAVSDINQVVGKIASTNFAEGEIVLKHRLLDDKDQIEILSHVIPPKKRAVSINVSYTSSVSNLIEPGDRVNVLVTYAPNENAQVVTETLLQDIPVLAVGQRLIPKDKLRNEQKNGANDYQAVTLDVDDTQARTLVHWQSRGTLYLTLRSKAKETSETQKE